MARRRRRYIPPYRAPSSDATIAGLPALTEHGDSPDLRALFNVTAAGFPFTKQVWSCWSSPERAAEYIESLPRSAFWCADQIFSDDTSFEGATLRDALRMMREGWQDGAERVARLRDRITATRPHGPRLARWDVAGAFTSVPRALSGDPLNMRRIDSATLRRRPVLTLINQVGGPSTVPAHCFINKAAVVAAIVDVIEAAGYSVNVLACAPSHDSMTSKLLGMPVVQIKQAGEHIDLPRLAFALGHTAFFRRIMFALYAAAPNLALFSAMFGRTWDTPIYSDGVTFTIRSLKTTRALFDNKDIAATEGLDSIITELRAQGCSAFPEREAA